MDRMMMRTGLWLLALSIITGAFGAHGLKMMVIPDRLETWHTAVQYHAWISILLIVLGGSFFRVSVWVYRLLILGLSVFSGSLYLLVILDVGALGAVTPFGGILLIAGISLAAITCREAD